MTAPIDLAPFIKAYDVRGLVGSQLTPRWSSARCRFRGWIDGAGEDVVVGYDVLLAGIRAPPSRRCRGRGGNVLSIGLCSTRWDLRALRTLGPGGNVHRQYNPATYNGIKFSRAGLRGISFDWPGGDPRPREALPRRFDRSRSPAPSAGMAPFVDLSGIAPSRSSWI
jgi:phosphomannomutase